MSCRGRKLVGTPKYELPDVLQCDAAFKENVVRSAARGARLNEFISQKPFLQKEKNKMSCVHLKLDH